MPAKKFDYAKTTAELDDILAQLQDSQIDLDQAMKLHGRGKELVAEMLDYLATAEVEIKKQLSEEA
jgi:exodeoxyribonuclease VII small subunit